MLRYNGKIINNGLDICVDATNNRCVPHDDLPLKSKLYFWFDSSDDAQFIYSGSNVVKWLDKSPNNYIMTPLTDGPTRTNTLNSKKVLTFTTSQALSCSNVDLSTSNYTIFIVSRYTGGTSRRTFEGISNNWLLGHHGGSANRYYANGWVYQTGTYSDSIWRIFTGTGNISDDLYGFYSTGSLLASNNAGANGPGGISINGGLYSSESSDCEIAEIIGYNTFITSSTELNLIHTYLSHKWNIDTDNKILINLVNKQYTGSFINQPIYDSNNHGSVVFDNDDYINTNYYFNNVCSISLWFKCPVQDSDAGSLLRPLIMQGNYGGTYPPDVESFDISIIREGISASGSLRFTSGTDVVGYNYTTENAYVDNVWYNAVFVRDKDFSYAYVDGILLNKMLSTTGISTATTVQIGGSSTSAARRYSGSISRVEIYNRALMPEEVLYSYNLMKSRYNK